MVFTPALGNYRQFPCFPKITDDREKDLTEAIT
jgi:hypothetical protein